MTHTGFPVTLDGETFTEAEFLANSGTAYKDRLPQMLNAAAADLLAKQTAAEQAATSAAATAGASQWVSGANYTAGACVWSPLTFQTYRRKTPGGGTTDPSQDSANWQLLGTAGRQATYIRADEFTPRPSGGPSAGTVQSGSGVVARTLDFDAASTEYAQISFMMPKRWNRGTVTMRPTWSTQSSTSGVALSYSYTHAYGTGNRSASITASTTFTLGGSVAGKWVDGNTSSDGAYVTSSQSASGKEIKFVFAAAVCIDQVRFVCEASHPQLGTFSWQGSNDGTNWTTLTSGISLMSGAGTTTYTVTPGVYTQYRFLGTSGTTGTGYWIFEAEFRAGNPITVLSSDGAAWCLRGVALGDAEALSADFGAAVTVVDVWQSASSAVLIGGESSAMTIAGAPAETDQITLEVYRDVTHSADTIPVDVRLHGVMLYWTSDAPTDD
jgi:hypothetical protein